MASAESQDSKRLRPFLLRPSYPAKEVHQAHLGGFLGDRFKDCRALNLMGLMGFGAVGLKSVRVLQVLKGIGFSEWREGGGGNQLNG